LVGSIFHMTRKIVSEMTYNVSMGTLNPTILLYYTTQHKIHKTVVQYIIACLWLHVCHYTATRLVLWVLAYNFDARVSNYACMSFCWHVVCVRVLITFGWNIVTLLPRIKLFTVWMGVACRARCLRWRIHFRTIYIYFPHIAVFTAVVH